jgi:hypothetical protein
MEARVNILVKPDNETSAYYAYYTLQFLRQRKRRLVFWEIFEAGCYAACYAC